MLWTNLTGREFNYDELVSRKSGSSLQELSDYLNERYFADDPDIAVYPWEFEWLEGQWMLDGMEPEEWAQAVTDE